MSGLRTRHGVVGTVLLLALLIWVSPAGAQQYPVSPKDITIHIVDYGMNDEWRPPIAWVVEPSADMMRDHDPLFRDTPRPVFKVLVIMPSDTDMARYSNDQLQSRIAKQIIPLIDDAVRHGRFEFEIRILEHLDIPRYLRQSPPKAVTAVLPGEDLAARFGPVAYRAIGLAIAHLRSSGANHLTIDATLGSNGTVLFAKAVAAWRDYGRLLSRVTFVDGRAFVSDVVAMLVTRIHGAPALPASRLRLVNTHGDIMARSHSIGSLWGSSRVQAQFGDVVVLELKPHSWYSPFKGAAHIASLIDGNGFFGVTEHYANGATQDWGNNTRTELYPLRDYAAIQRANGYLPAVGEPDAAAGVPVPGSGTRRNTELQGHSDTCRTEQGTSKCKPAPNSRLPPPSQCGSHGAGCASPGATPGSPPEPPHSAVGGVRVDPKLTGGRADLDSYHRAVVGERPSGHAKAWKPKTEAGQ